MLRVVDVDTMLRFYCDALGCSVDRREDDIGLIQLRAGRSLIDFVPVDNFKEILGMPVKADTDLPGSAVPRMTCRLVRTRP